MWGANSAIFAGAHGPVMADGGPPSPVNRIIAAGLCLVACAASAFAEERARSLPVEAVESVSPLGAAIEQYCTDCHNADDKKGDLDLEGARVDDLHAQPQLWEKVVRRLRARQMPPADKKRPDESLYTELLARLESALDTHAARDPNPGRTETVRRLNRTEYQNAIRDLLAVEIDATMLLPKDEAGH